MASVFSQNLRSRIVLHQVSSCKRSAPKAAHGKSLGFASTSQPGKSQNYHTSLVVPTFGSEVLAAAIVVACAAASGETLTAEHLCKEKTSTVVQASFDGRTHVQGSLVEAVQAQRLVGCIKFGSEEADTACGYLRASPVHCASPSDQTHNQCGYLQSQAQ